MIKIKKYMQGLSRITKWSLLVALLFHALLFVVLGLHSNATATGMVQKTVNASAAGATRIMQTPIKAHAVDSQQVAAQIKAIRQQKERQAARERRRLQQLRKTARAAKKSRQQALNTLANIKKQQRAAAKKLAKTKLQQKLAMAALSTSKNSIAKKNNNALAAKKSTIGNAKKASLNQKGQLDKYKTAILAAISRNWVLPVKYNTNLSCQLLISLAADGKVLQVRLIKSSGDVGLDRSARLAVLKSSPLPVPKNTGLFKQFQQLRLTVRPEDFNRRRIKNT